jgi:hypothetical protein
MEKEFKPPTEMTKAELKDWKLWAENEISEYQDLIDEINKELKKRFLSPKRRRKA